MVKGKGPYSSLWIGNPSQSYGASPAMWDHTVLAATRHRWTCPALQAGTRFTYPGGMEGWVDLVVGYIPRWFTCPQTVTHPGTNHLIATRPGVKPTTLQSQVQRPNHYTTKPLCGDCCIVFCQARLQIIHWIKSFIRGTKENHRSILRIYCVLLNWGLWDCRKPNIR